MKKVDYYAVQQSWKMPKWLGLTLGGVFGVIVLGSAVAAYELTKPAPSAVPEVAAAAAAPAVAAPVVTTVAPVTVTATSAPKSDAVASRHAKHGAKKSKHVTVASNKAWHAKTNAILAKHDSKEKRKAKDDIDKLLGL